MRGTCNVVVFGETVSLPLTFEAAQALEEEGLCAYRLTLMAARKGEPLILGLTQACRILAIGLETTAMGRNLRARDLWAKARREGANGVILPATEYMASLAAESDVGERAQVVGGHEDPKL